MKKDVLQSDSVKKQWLKISAPCPDSISEPVSDLLSRLSGAGVEINSDGKGAAKVTGYFPMDIPECPDKKNARLEQLKIEVVGQLETIFSYLDHSFILPIFDIVVEEDWSSTWKEFFTPFEIVEGLVISPSWEEYEPIKGQQVIELDPGMAFGTGQHASTQFALLLMREVFKRNTGVKPERILDVGTGTGILAMAAALYGAGNVVAMDNDPDAVEACCKNVTANKLDKIIEVSGENLVNISGSFDLICANIVHDVLESMAPIFKKLIKVGGSIVLAGILHGKQEENIIKVFAGMGIQTKKTEYKDEWVALLLERKE